MFENVIRETPFLTPQADQSLGNIVGNAYNGDSSFLSCLRALCGNRVPKDECIVQRFSSARFYGDTSEENMKNVLRRCVDEEEPGTNGKLVIFDLRCRADNNQAVMDFSLKYMQEHFPGFSVVPKFHEWFRMGKILAHLLVNPERKSSIILVDRLTVKKLHLLCIGIPVCLPWYFGKDQALTEEERKLIDSLGQPDVSKFEDEITKLAEAYDFRSAAIRRMLAGFETRYERQRAAGLERDIQSQNVEIERLNRRIRETLERIDEMQVTLLGLRYRLNAGIKDEDSEIMQYCLQNKNITVDDVTDREFAFSCKAYADIFNEDAAEACIDNPWSSCYSKSRFSKEKTAALLKAIFVDRKIRLRFCASYRLYLSGEVSAISNGDFGSAEYSTYLPNPHIQHYHCLGSYTQYINRFLQSRNYPGAIEQCIASCASLNWNDDTVMQEFFADLLDRYAGSRRCLELPDGQLVTAVGAVSWLEAEGEVEHEQEEEA